MIDTSYNGNTLQIDDKEIEFNHKIVDAFVVEDLIIVDLKIRRSSESNQGRNILALDTEGSIQWRIKACKGAPKDSPYHSIRYKDGRLVAKCLDGYIYEVDINTGSVTQIDRYDK